MDGNGMDNEVEETKCKKDKGILRRKVAGVSLRSIIWNCAKKVIIITIYV